MAKSFEEFEVYKKGIVLTKQVYLLLSKSTFDKEFDFKSQLKRAGYSITNNIAEGSEYDSNKQFVRFLKIAKGSCGEVRNMLILSKELGYLSQEEINGCYNLTVEVAQNLSNFIKYLNNTKKD